jgi:hypothetical protein
LPVPGGPQRISEVGPRGRSVRSGPGSQLAQGRTLPEEMLLAHYLVQGTGTHGSTILTSKSGNRFLEAKATAEHAARIFSEHRIEYIVPGGDRVLVDQVLAQPSLRTVSGRTRLAFLDVQAPKSSVLAKAAADACAVRITVTDPPAQQPADQQLKN